MPTSEETARVAWSSPDAPGSAVWRVSPSVSPGRRLLIARLRRPKSRLDGRSQSLRDCSSALHLRRQAVALAGDLVGERGQLARRCQLAQHPPRLRLDAALLELVEHAQP